MDPTTAQDDDTKMVLAMNLGMLTPEDLKWIHDLKNKATVMQARLQIKHAKENQL